MLTMRRTMTRVEQIWQEITEQTSGVGIFRRIDESHPLDLYVGTDHNGKRVLMLVTYEAPATLPPPGLVEVACNQRGDKDFAIIIQLARQEFDELFGRLCQDLVDATREVPRVQGGEALMRRLSRWRKLLEIKSRKTLSETALRGLVGELWFLQSVALPRMGVDASVQGWVGPFDAPQDFRLGEALVEIKTCVPGAHEVTIASLQQLDGGNAPLYLGVVWLASANPTVTEAFSVAQLIGSLHTALEVSPIASNEFALRLAEVGYSECEEYERAWYRVTQVRYFRVQDDFPRLIPSRTPAGVRDARYVIDLELCGMHECQL